MKNKIILIPIAVILLSITGIFLTIHFEGKSTGLDNTLDFEFGNDFPSSLDDFSRTGEMPYSNEEGGVSRPERRKNEGISSINPPGDNFNLGNGSIMTERFGNKKLSTIGITIISGCTILFTISLIYLIQSKLCTVKLSLKKEELIIFILETVIISLILNVGLILITNNYIFDNNISNYNIGNRMRQYE